MVKFLHAADLHLDSPLRGLENYDGAPADRIRVATRRALENLVGLAIEERVAFVLLAGDLYDGDWQDYNTGQFLVRQMSRLRGAGIAVFAIAGNHDAHSKMTRKLRLPENVAMLSTETPETRPLERFGVAIHGQGFSTQAVTDDLSKRYPSPIRDLYNIGLLHTCVEGVEGHSSYAPCKTRELAEKGYDYWALGHIHRRETLNDRPHIAFPGNLQGRHVREAGPKGCLLVTTADGGASKVEFRRLDVVRWEVCEVVAGEAKDEEDLAETACGQIERMLSEEDPDHLLAVRVVVRGPTRLHERLLSDPGRCAAEVRARAVELGEDRLWVERVKIETTPERSTIFTGDGPVGELFALIAEMRSDEAWLREAGGLLGDLRQRLPAEFLQAPDAPALDDPAWLLGVLDTAEALLGTRLRS